MGTEAFPSLEWDTIKSLKWRSIFYPFSTRPPTVPLALSETVYHGQKELPMPALDWSQCPAVESAPVKFARKRRRQECDIDSMLTIELHAFERQVSGFSNIAGLQSYLPVYSNQVMLRLPSTANAGHSHSKELSIAVRSISMHRHPESPAKQRAWESASAILTATTTV